MKTNPVAVIAILLSSAFGATPAAQANLLGPSPYLSSADSPFNGGTFSYFHLEDFEDGALNTPGVAASGGIVLAASALTEQQPTIFGNLDSRSLNNAPLKGAQDVLAIYARRILDAIERDGFYTRVPSGKQFYLYVLQTIDRSAAEIGGSETPFDQSSPADSSPAESSAHPPNLAVAPSPSESKPSLKP